MTPLDKRLKYRCRRTPCLRRIREAQNRNRRHPPPNPGRGRSFRPRPEIERILGERPPKVKVAQLFVALIAQLFSNCDNSATRRHGIRPIVRDKQGRQLALLSPAEHKLLKSLTQARVE